MTCLLLILIQGEKMRSSLSRCFFALFHVMVSKLQSSIMGVPVHSDEKNDNRGKDSMHF